MKSRKPRSKKSRKSRKPRSKKSRKSRKPRSKKSRKSRKIRYKKDGDLNIDTLDDKYPLFLDNVKLINSTSFSDEVKYELILKAYQEIYGFPMAPEARKARVARKGPGRRMDSS
jgi:hypothetical protein